MSSKEIGINLLPPHSQPPPRHPHHHHHLNPPLLLHHQNDDSLRRFATTHQPHPVDSSSIPKPSPSSSSAAAGFIDDHHRYFDPQPFRRELYRDNGPQSGDGSDGDEDDDDDGDDDDEDEGDHDDDIVDDGDRRSRGESENNNSRSNINNTNHEGSRRAPLVKDGDFGQEMSDDRATPGENHQQLGRMRNYQNEVTVAGTDSELYYAQYLQSTEASASGQKDLAMESGCGYNGRKFASILNESGESLRVIFSDPITGTLMDDAMILPCGHSFGGGGIQHVIRMKACSLCSHTCSKDLISPNLSLRDAVQAFRREEELHLSRSSKRRRERFDQERGNHVDLSVTDPPRSRGVQFPFAVTDRVIIKGNKRTPERFVGREAVVTTQCLNGWYVVKTLDNAESVKLQYRSLAKVTDNPSSNSMSTKMNTNWL